MLRGSQIIPTWRRNEPKLRLDSYVLDRSHHPDVGQMTPSLFIYDQQKADAIKEQGYGSCTVGGTEDWTVPLCRDVIAERLSEPAIKLQSTPLLRGGISTPLQLREEHGALTVYKTEGNTGRGTAFFALTVLLHL